MPNRLQLESSPYLKQHQYNPVDWYPWGEEALSKAKKENKLIIISIGYAACHWCHVMERESFENTEVAKVMNDHFVAVKVDREERPDIDQVYMTAVQLMKGQGGWPLNVICLPDGRPIYGGTYFKPEEWISILIQLNETWLEKPDVAYDYAERLTEGIVRSDLIPYNEVQEPFRLQDLIDMVSDWKNSFDAKYGGNRRVPKFPLPNNWLFLLRYGFHTKDNTVLDHVHFTLKKIACGGIYDQVGGGFARYSVDAEWHIPHFEKMLYDNALLISLYSEAYLHKRDPHYKRIVYETIAWVKREMTHPSGAFYSSLDADSDGVEGRYYCFTEREIREALGDDAELFVHYFQISSEGNWAEMNTNVLKIDEHADTLAQDVGYTAQEWENYLAETKRRLWDYREKRNRPALDDKILCSWNAMMIRSLSDAYRVFDQPDFLDVAKKCDQFISENLLRANDRLLRQPEHRGRQILGFLDDYAFYIDALIGLYECTFEVGYLLRAKKLTDRVLVDFWQKGDTVFSYSSQEAEQLIADKKEVMDDVIPSSNSVFVGQLFKLGLFFDDDNYRSMAMQTLANVFPQIKTYPSAFSNWAILVLEEVVGVNEIAITGPKLHKYRKELDQVYLPNRITLGGTEENLPLLKNKIGQTTKVYVCRNKSCSKPVNSIPAALNLIFNPGSN